MGSQLRRGEYRKARYGFCCQCDNCLDHQGHGSSLDRFINVGEQYIHVRIHDGKKWTGRKMREDHCDLFSHQIAKAPKRKRISQRKYDRLRREHWKAIGLLVQLIDDISADRLSGRDEIAGKLSQVVVMSGFERAPT
jgi:hypothetical protein